VSGLRTPLVEQRLKAAGRAGEEKGFESSEHVIFYHNDPLNASSPARFRPEPFIL
jgi:hypothetical protein